MTEVDTNQTETTEYRKTGIYKPTYFNHDGSPSLKDQVEILKVVALSLSFIGGTAGIGLELFSGGPLITLNSFLVGLVFFAGLTISIWSFCLSFMAIKGNVKFMDTKGPMIVALGFLFAAISWPIAIIAGLIF